MSEWRGVPSFPEYEASDQGQIRLRVGRGGRPGKIRATYPSWNGYRAVHIGPNGGLRMLNRLVCEAWNGLPPTPEHQAAHEDGDRLNNRPSNLVWKTRVENYQDQIRHGTSKKGEGHHHARLTNADVLSIRALAGKRTGRAIAAQFGLSEGHVSGIINRRLWSHI